jgi:hypothetical protein
LLVRLPVEQQFKRVYGEFDAIWTECIDVIIRNLALKLAGVTQRFQAHLLIIKGGFGCDQSETIYYPKNDINIST